MSASAVRSEFGLAEGLRQATALLEQLTSSAGDRDCQVPPWVLKEARGVAFLFTYKVGVFASVSGGTGVVMRRLPGSNAWGPPVAIGLGGGGGGLDFGVNKTQQLVVIRSDEAVEAFMKPSAKLSIGLNIAAGPVGRQIEEAGHISKDKAVNAFTYALTQGIFAGVGVQGMFVKEREEENRRFYGLDAKRAAVELSKTPLSDCPEAATKLQSALDAIASKK